MATAAARSNVHRLFHPATQVNIPTEDELERIPLAQPGRYRCNQQSADFIRRRCYRLNQDNAVYRFRTMYDGRTLLVFRLSK